MRISVTSLRGGVVQADDDEILRDARRHGMRADRELYKDDFAAPRYCAGPRSTAMSDDIGTAGVLSGRRGGKRRLISQHLSAVVSYQGDRVRRDAGSGLCREGTTRSRAAGSTCRRRARASRSLT